MASQVVDEILAAEAEARAKLEQAREQAGQLLDDADAKASAILEETRAEARRQAAAILEGAAAKAKTIRSAKAGQARQRADDLYKSVRAKQDAAADRVIAALIP